MLVTWALAASLVVANASPSLAVTDRADHTTRLTACVGPAIADQGFTDVSADHVFAEAINCIAYYGITQGTGDGSTYSPETSVTRAQMAVFIARAAEVAGANLAAATRNQFSDLAGNWPEATDAINRLAAEDIIASGGAFRPTAAITRAEMATFLVGLLVETAPRVRRDSQGTILLGAGGSVTVADDYFADTRNAETSALYELGVTRGSNAAAVQDPANPPLDFVYEPALAVTRGQMAAFITRALAHTVARPAGLTAQFDGTSVVVSVRDNKFSPAPATPVDVFWAPTAQANDVLAPDGTCRLSAVTQADESIDPCEIDLTDPSTSNGDVTIEVNGLRRVPAGDATVWAWAGDIGETVADDTILYRLDVAESDDVDLATLAVLAETPNARKFRFGSPARFTLQLHDAVGAVRNGVNGIDPASYRLSIQVPGATEPDVSTLVTNSRGLASFTIPSPSSRSTDVTVTYTLTSADNAPPVVNADGTSAATGRAIFSAGSPSIADGSATVLIEAQDYMYVSGGSAVTTVRVTVLDQYGSPFSAAKVKLNNGAEFTANDRGFHSFRHSYTGTTGSAETLTVGYGSANADAASETATFYWAVEAGSSSGDDTWKVVAGSVNRHRIVVTDDSVAQILFYDQDDRFNLRGRGTTIEAFEAELAAALASSAIGFELTWENYGDKVATISLN